MWREFSGALLRRWRSLWAPLTPGQRWTGALAFAMALILLLFGMSPELPPILRPITGNATDSAVASVGPDNAETPPGVPTGTVQLGGADLATSTVPASAGISSFPAPRFVALVHDDPSDPTGRDDAEIARTFVGRSGLAFTIVDDAGSNDEVCQRVAAAGNVVIAGTGGAPAVTECLVERGVTVVAYDALGDRPPRSGTGQVVSTRRGAGDSLVDIAQWGAVSGALAGRVGIAASQSLKPFVETRIAEMREAGLNVVAQRYVATGKPDAEKDVSDGVLALSEANVDVVVFALPVSYQARWVSLSKTLASGIRFVTTDAEDAIVSESYPPLFDGALAFTSVRVPWFARAHGETKAQSDCRSKWEADHATLLAGAETVSVYAWCEAVALVLTTERTMPTGADFGAALRATRQPSGLTSDLGPLAGGDFGPTESAVLRWSAGCACWTEKTPFAPRPPET